MHAYLIVNIDSKRYFPPLSLTYRPSVAPAIASQTEQIHFLQSNRNKSKSIYKVCRIEAARCSTVYQESFVKLWQKASRFLGLGDDDVDVIEKIKVFEAHTRPSVN